MIGYLTELQQLVALLDCARQGRGGAVVVEGEAGIGKSTLCAAVTQAASGMEVLATRGSESEVAIPFAGLFDLFSHLGPEIDRLAPARAAALRGALALGPAAAGDQLAVAAATLDLLTVRDVPALVVVDDAHWIDDSSLVALAFAARRLDDRPVALVFSRRKNSGNDDRLAQVPRIRLAGLDRQSAVQLLQVTTPACSESVASSLWSATAGNPLALIELARGLDAAVLSGQRRLPAPLPIGPRLSSLFGEHLTHLDSQERFALLVLALAPDARGYPGRVLSTAGIPIDGLDRVRFENLIDIDGGEPRFRHPLVRSAVIDQASPADRRVAESLLAEAFTEDPIRHLLHLAAAASGPDEALSLNLKEAALSAVDRAGYAEAAVAMSRAREVSADATTRLETAIAAARYQHLAGRSREAIHILESALAEAGDPRSRAAVQEARGQIELWLGNPRAARDLLATEADLVEPFDVVAAARLRIQASMPSVMIGDLGAAKDLALRGYQVLGDLPGLPGVLSAAALAETLMILGDKREGVRLTERAVAGLGEFAEDVATPLAFLVVHCLTVAECLDEAIHFANRIVALARSRGAPSVLPAPLTTLADLYSRIGDLAQGLACAEEALELAAELGHVTEEAHATVILGRIEALMGRDRAPYLARTAIQMSRDSGAESLEAYGHHVLGLVAIAAGRASNAVQELEEVRRVTELHGVVDPYVLPWEPDLAEALIRAGETERASGLVDDLEKRATTTQSRWALAAAHRCRGQLGGNETEGHFRQAVDGFAETGNLLDLARTELAWGEWLRRARRRLQARQHLSLAAAGFRRCGAEPWAQRALAELRAAGGSADAPGAGIGDLTPQEVRIAVRVAMGETNAEVAQALFLSPKTIENRLTTIYSKLGIRSRTQLANLVNQHPKQPGNEAPATKPGETPLPASPLAT